MDASLTPLHGKPVTCGPRKGAPCPPPRRPPVHTRSPDFTVKKLRPRFRANKLLQEHKGPSGHMFPPGPRGGSTWGPSAVNRAPSVLRPRPVPGLRGPRTLLCLGGGGPKCKPEQLLTKHKEQTRESWDQMAACGRSTTRPTVSHHQRLCLSSTEPIKTFLKIIHF